jgi:hypothetical protein
MTTTTTETYLTGPTNDNYGYVSDYVAPAEQVEEAARLRGKPMWDALSHCDWTEIANLPDDAIVGGTYSPDGERLFLSSAQQTAAELRGRFQDDTCEHPRRAFR